MKKEEEHFTSMKMSGSRFCDAKDTFAKSDKVRMILCKIIYDCWTEVCFLLLLLQHLFSIALKLCEKKISGLEKCKKQVDKKLNFEATTSLRKLL